jgi:hypothetical protein
MLGIIIFATMLLVWVMMFGAWRDIGDGLWK